MIEHTKGTMTTDWMMAGYGRESRRMETLNAEGYGTIGLAYTPEDARRFAACWNACAGLSTEALEAGALGGLVGAIKGYNESPSIEAALAKLEGKS